MRNVSGAEEYIAEEKRKLGRVSHGERNTLFVLLLALALWFAPGIVGLVAGDDSKTYESFSDHVDEGVVAILAAALLFVLPLD